MGRRRCAVPVGFFDDGGALHPQAGGVAAVAFLVQAGSEPPAGAVCAGIVDRFCCSALVEQSYRGSNLTTSLRVRVLTPHGEFDATHSLPPLPATVLCPGRKLYDAGGAFRRAASLLFSGAAEGEEDGLRAVTALAEEGDRVRSLVGADLRDATVHEFVLRDGEVGTIVEATDDTVRVRDPRGKISGHIRRPDILPAGCPTAGHDYRAQGGRHDDTLALCEALDALYM